MDDKIISLGSFVPYFYSPDNDSFSMQIGGTIYEAVSYTHLDVYKRQAESITVQAYASEVEILSSLLSKILNSIPFGTVISVSYTHLYGVNFSLQAVLCAALFPHLSQTRRKILRKALCQNLQLFLSEDQACRNIHPVRKYPLRRVLMLHPSEEMCIRDRCRTCKL